MLSRPICIYYIKRTNEPFRKTFLLIQTVSVLYSSFRTIKIKPSVKQITIGKKLAIFRSGVGDNIRCWNSNSVPTDTETTVIAVKSSLLEDPTAQRQ